MVRLLDSSPATRRREQLWKSHKRVDPSRYAEWRVPRCMHNNHPGESFRSMRVLMVSFPSDGPESYHIGVNAHRRLLARFKVPRGLDGNVLGALTSALGWWGYPNCPNMTVGSAMSLLDAVKASAAVQAYWLDASWFNGCFPNGVGNWQLPLSAVIDQRELPNDALADLGAAAHAAPNPLQWILWVEPERVAQGTYIQTHHPDFLIPNNASDLIDLGQPAARAYLTEFLLAAVAALDLDVLRLDFNTQPSSNWAQADSPGREGVAQVRYIEGLYSMWDAVLASKPGLLIDNCASGGRRIDLETLSRSVPLWRSDYAQPGQAAEAQQAETMGLSGFAPVHAGTTDRYDPYMWRSTGAVGKTIIFTESVWAALLSNATAMGELRAAQAETARLRPLAMFGDYYPLSVISSDDPGCAAWQHHCDGRSQCGAAVWGALHVFRRPAAAGPTCAVAPFAIIDTARYNVSFYFGYSFDHAEEMSGAALGALRVALPLPSSAALVEYACTAAC